MINLTSVVSGKKLRFNMNAGWNGQYDSFQGQSGSFYDPASSQYNYDASTGSSQPGSNAYPNFMTPADPYATLGNCDVISFVDKCSRGYACLLSLDRFNSSSASGLMAS